MKYIKSEKYSTPELQSKIMGPNPIKLEEELLCDSKIPRGAVVCDLGSGEGLTSVFLAKEYGTRSMRRICGAIPRIIKGSLKKWDYQATE